MNIIKLEDLNSNKIIIKNMQNTNNGTLYTQYVKYNYDKTQPKHKDNVNTDCIFLTDLITLGSGSGIPQINQAYRPTNNDCMYMWITDEKKTKGTEKFFYNLSSIDEDIDDNLEFITVNGIELQKLKYMNLVKSSNQGDYLKYDNRVKVRLSTFKNPEDDKLLDAKITTKVFLPVDMNKNHNEIEFKSTSENIESLDDLRKLVPFGSTIQMTIQISKFWARKTLHNGMRDCGLILKCLQIFVYDNRQKKLGFDYNVIPNGLGIKVSQTNSQTQLSNFNKQQDDRNKNDKNKDDHNIKPSSKKSYKSYVDTNSDNESEEEKPKKKNNER